MKPPEVGLLIPCYRTRALTELCFKYLFANTDLTRVQIIAVDNNSGDGTAEYLKTLPNVTLIERVPEGESGPQMHAKALDDALELVSAPLVIAMHTDTIVLRPDWLDFLLE